MCKDEEKTLKTLNDDEKDALKALQDWSKWLVAIQAGVIAFGGEGISSEFFYQFAIWSFLVSIIIGTILVGSIPPILQGTNIKEYAKAYLLGWPLSGIYKIKKFNLPIAVYAFFEHIFFIIGLVFIGVTVSLAINK